MTYYEVKLAPTQFAENGMGYQEIEVNAGSQSGNYIVFNNKYAFPKEEIAIPTFNVYQNFQELLDSNEHRGQLQMAAIRLSPNPGATPISPIGAYVPPPFSFLTAAGDTFYRLSAYAADHCIINVGVTLGELRPNSYTITRTDLNMVPSGLAAVGRYALPSRTATIYCWEIQPPIGTLVHVGTVIPNFGLAGGGVEAFFPNGFRNGSIQPITNLLEFLDILPKRFQISFEVTYSILLT